MDYRQRIAEILEKVLAGPGFETEKPTPELLALIEVPKDSSMGDLAFPCFLLAKVLRKAPPAIATELESAVSRELGDGGLFSRVVAVGPYLNFHVNKLDLTARLLPEILSGELLARREARNERVMIEYSQPNTHKPFHVGHTRNVALGDALVRSCEWAGYDVVAANYIGDVGAHIAKCLWVYQSELTGEVPEKNRGEFLGGLYTRATELLDFTTLTRAPHLGILTARVTAVADHPSNEKWKVVTVNIRGAETSVVCGGTGYGVGDVVAYAPVGRRVAGREVTVTDRDGVLSHGMICSKKEITLGEARDEIHVFADDSPVGEEIAELLRIDGALPRERSVIEEMRSRERGVSKVLQDLEAGEPEITKLWRETRQWSLDEFAEIYKWLDVRFDHDFFESDVADAGKEIVKKYLGAGVFVVSEGAVGADLSRFKLPFLLLLKSDGTGLYATKDLALAQLKFDEFHIDRSVYVVGEEQILHFQQVFRTLELMGHERARLCHHLAYGLVVLPEGKMSSRKGNVILFSQLQERLIARLRSEFLDKFQDEWSEDEIIEAARRLAVATIKYGMLNTDSRKSIVFDLEEWTAKRGNTGPYLMYAYTRTRSILRELGDIDRSLRDWSLLVHEKEQELVRRLAAFTDVACQAAESYQPQYICMYLYDLSRDFSRMYEVCHVKRAETPELQVTRAGLVEATGLVIQKGLELLGIRTLERM